MTCVSVPFSKLHEHIYPYCFSWYEGLFTNKLWRSSLYQTHVHQCLVSTCALHNMHLSLFFDVICTQVHCLPAHYDHNVFTTLLESCCSSLDYISTGLHTEGGGALGFPPSSLSFPPRIRSEHALMIANRTNHKTLV